MKTRNLKNILHGAGGKCLIIKQFLLRRYSGSTEVQKILQITDYKFIKCHNYTNATTITIQSVAKSSLSCVFKSLIL